MWLAGWLIFKPRSNYFLSLLFELVNNIHLFISFLQDQNFSYYRDGNRFIPLPDRHGLSAYHLILLQIQHFLSFTVRTTQNPGGKWDHHLELLLPEMGHHLLHTLAEVIQGHQ